MESAVFFGVEPVELSPQKKMSKATIKKIEEKQKRKKTYVGSTPSISDIKDQITKMKRMSLAVKSPTMKGAAFKTPEPFGNLKNRPSSKLTTAGKTEDSSHKAS